MSLLPFVLIDDLLLTIATQTVQQALSSEGYCQFQSRWVFVVTWHNISVNGTNTTVDIAFDFCHGLCGSNKLQYAC